MGKVRKVHAVRTVVVDQGIGKNNGVVFLDGSVEGIVDWRLNDYLAPWSGKRANQHIKRWHQPGSWANPLRVDFPTVSPLHPAGY
jgi:hypothetical protein